MPFYEDLLDEDKTLNGEPVTTGPGSSSLSTSGEGAKVTGEKNPGNFVGIQQYIAQNRPQTANLATNITTGVESEADKAKSTISDQSSAFGADVEKSRVNLNQPLLEEASTNSVSVANDPTKLAQFKAMRDANYTGPESFESTDFFNKASNATKKAQDLSNQLSNEEGQKQILKGMQKQTNLNKGALTLDSALLSSDPDAQQRLKAAQQSSAGLGAQLSEASTAGNLQAQQARQSTGLTAEAIRNAFTGANNPQAKMQDAINARVLAAQQGYTTREDLAGNPDLTAAQLSNIGLTQEQYNELRQDVNTRNDLVNYLPQTIDRSNINKNTVATADEYAKQAALNSLMGSDSNFITAPELAGTGNLQSAGIDKVALVRGAIAKAATSLNAAQANAAAAAAEKQRVIQQYFGNVQGIDRSDSPRLEASWDADIAAQAELARQQAIYNNNVAKYKSYN